jgi:hypothetical protein
MADYNDITSATIAVVFVQDGMDDYYPCHDGADVQRAVQEVISDGGVPVVFYRDGHGRPDAAQAPARNSVTGPVSGQVVQCQRIEGGVRF